MSEKHNNEDMSYPSKSSNGVAASVLALSVVVALLVGLIAGFFIGENRATSRYEKLIAAGVYNTGSGTQVNNPSNTTNPVDDEDARNEALWNSIDYTQFKINDSMDVDTFYGDDAETKYYVSQVFGKSVPEFKWTDAEGVEHSNKELDGNYIIELFSSSCTYCNASIPEVDKFRENSGHKVVSLCLDDGDLTNFNASGENAWELQNQDASDVAAFLNSVPWVPAFIYVKDGNVGLVTFGGVEETDLNTNWTLVYGE